MARTGWALGSWDGVGPVPIETSSDQLNHICSRYLFIAVGLAETLDLIDVFHELFDGVPGLEAGASRVVAHGLFGAGTGGIDLRQSASTKVKVFWAGIECPPDARLRSVTHAVLDRRDSVTVAGGNPVFSSFTLRGCGRKKGSLFDQYPQARSEGVRRRT